MKLALVQRAFGCISIKLANTVEELLTLEFQFNPNVSPPRIHRVSDEACQDESGASVASEVSEQHKRGEFKTMRLP